MGADIFIGRARRRFFRGGRERWKGKVGINHSMRLDAKSGLFSGFRSGKSVPRPNTRLHRVILIHVLLGHKDHPEAPVCTVMRGCQL